jgi:dTDP-glucose pyrophosphorylase
MLNIVMPLAGEGSRFAKMGYKNPKPFIEVLGKYMALHVVDNINIPGAKYIFLIQSRHLEEFGASFIEELKKRSFVHDFEIIPIKEKTSGAACTVLLAKSFISNTDELLIINGDQIINDDFSKALVFFARKKADGGIWCFFNTSSKWSYVDIDSNRHIIRVAEKIPISNHATCGVYYFKHGKDWVTAAERMIEKNDKVNNEFYVAPVFNYLILEEKVILPWFVNEMHGIGTPEDLTNYLQT